MNRRSSSTQHGLEKRGKPIVLPLLALLIALGGWFADQGRRSEDKSEAQGAVIARKLTHDPVSAISGIDNGTAVTCERHPLITHCFRLTQERR